MRIRTATADDAAAIRNVHVLAFPTAQEADLVEQLIADGDAVVSFVADDHGEVGGHILLSRMDAEADGEAVSALGLAPVAVVPDRQRQGVGGALIEAAIEAAREAGAEMVFLLGDPDYYRRFGFDAATAGPIASSYAGPYFQALAVAEGVSPLAGRAEYAPAFANLA